jgi:hypothetical protein
VDAGNAVALCHRGRALLQMQQAGAAGADLRAALALLQQGGGAGQVAHMELNGAYWEQRIQGLLAGLQEQEK